MANQGQQSGWVAISIAITGALATLILGYLYLELGDERSRLLDEVGSLQQRLEHERRDQTELRQSLEQSRSQARLEIERLQAAMGEAGTAVVERDQAMARLRADAARQSQLVTELRAEVDRQGQRVTELRAEAATLAGRLAEVEPAKQRLDTESEARLLQLQQSLAQIRQLQDELEASRAERDRLQADLQHSRTAATALRAAVAAAAEQQLELDRQLQSTRLERDRLQQELQAVAAARSLAAQKASAALREQRELQQRLEAAEAAIAAREAAIARSGSVLTELQQKLVQTGGETRQLAGRIEDLEQRRQAEAARFDRLREDLQQAVQSREVRIEQLRNRLTLIKLGSEILFPSGSAELKPSGRQALQLVAELLNQYPQRLISVEGHTDSVPIGDNLAFGSNWELSVARSAAAVRFLQEQAAVDPARMTVIGYGEFRPVADNSTPAGRAANRRIEILLSPPRDSFELLRAGADGQDAAAAGQ